MVHEPIPENHRFVYREVRAEDTDFRRRCEFYQGMCAPIATPTVQVDAACQVIGILKPDPERFNRVRDRLEEFSVVRTTSPMDGHNMWMEIFPYCVSKSAGSEWLMTWLGIDVEHRTYALGNDYNDLDLLAWAAHSAVTDNAPDELKHIFEVTVSNNDHALSEAVRAWGLLGGEGGGEREG
jgi:hydroxymethylpyrimidine pyrophosphatase-like HAD family hydrolase